MKPPLFIVGCPRSGTSFLYHLLLSAGGFAEFRTQMNVFDVLQPIYGDLAQAENKRRMLVEWLRSKAFRASGLEAAGIEAKVMAECRGAGDFLRIVMEAVARRQGVDCWIDSTPTNIPHMLRIGREFPQARFVHMIRDGRDVALSLDKRGWTRPLPGDKKNLLAAGLYWEWMVRQGRKYGVMLQENYIEVRYESLVQSPRETLAKLAAFLQRDLDYQRIRKNSVGSVKNPLTSFKEDLQSGYFNPVGRWRQKFPADQLARFESLVGAYLQELGYPLSAARPTKAMNLAARRLIYKLYYPAKQWAKVNTPLSRWMVDYSEILIDK